MNRWTDTLFVLVVLTNLRLLGTSRITACIRVVAVQGILIGLLPVIAYPEEFTFRFTLLAAISIFTKGIAFPWLLHRAVREADARRELEPIVGYSLSLLIGGALLAVALWLGKRLPLPAAFSSSLMVPAAMFTMMIGLFMIVARRKAITQVLGYLAMENGIYTFGLAFARKQPSLIEMGILLDAFMAVFVMGIMIHHINREFDHIDVDRMSSLRE